MSNNQIIKIIYHLIVAILLLFITFSIKNLHIVIKGMLVFAAIFHLYDVWWFSNYDKNAPI
jgi:hypothetical protein